MPNLEATGSACANIAFIKYWGNRDPALRLPLNGSLSMNLSDATTTTHVRFMPDCEHDRIVIDGVERDGPVRQRVVDHLDRLRQRAAVGWHATVESRNSFPMGTGIASSASGFAALTVAAAAALDLTLTERELSALARRGSGSAARSIPGGFVEWLAGEDDASSYASSIAPVDHWDLRDLVAIVYHAHKSVGSSDGHAAADTSAYLPARLLELEQRLPAVRHALLDRDLARLGPAIEAEALSLHAVGLTSRPPILYWMPETVALLRHVWDWRAAGLNVFFTLDAGPNVHLLCRGADAEEVASALKALPFVEAILHNRVGGAARVS